MAFPNFGNKGGFGGKGGNKGMAAPSGAMKEHITKKKRKKGFGLTKAPHPKLGFKKPILQDLGTPYLNE